MKKVLFSILAVSVFSGCTSFEEIKHQADSGNPEMQYEVALMYRAGDGVPADNQKASEYMMLALQNNHMPAAWELVQDIYRQKDIKRASDFVKAYEILLSTEPRTFADHRVAFASAKHVKTLGIEYLRLLAKENCMETKNLRNLFLTKLPKEYLDRREREKINIRVSQIRSTDEIAEEKRIAEENGGCAWDKGEGYYFPADYPSIH